MNRSFFVSTAARLARSILLLLVLLPVALPLTAVSAQSNVAGYRDFTYPSGTGANNEPTGEKPESKLWWNDGSWYASMWSTGGNAYRIHRLDLATQKWTDTGITLDNRKNTRADVLWDGTKLYVVSHVFVKDAGAPAAEADRGRLYRYSYNASNKSYALDTGFPVTVTGGKAETVVIEKDNSGQLWVTYVESRKVMVNHSLNGNDRTWGTPYALPAGGMENVAADDISSIITYRNHVGIMWSRQVSGSPKTMYFAVHPVGGADSAWTRARAFSASGDDHINLKTLQTDNEGNIYAAVKTSNNSNLILVLVCSNRINQCRSDADWQAHTVYNSAEFNPTRPIMLLDTSNRHIYVFTTNTDSSGITGIYYKRASMDNISFQAGGIGTPFIRTTTDTNTSNATSTKQNVNSLTGLVVMACSTRTRYYLHNYMPLGGDPPPPPPPAPSISGYSPASGPAGTQVTIIGSSFSGATQVTFNGAPAATFTVDSATQIRATVPAGATTGPIAVTTPNGTGSSSSSFTVTSTPPPAPSISGFSPTSGPVGTQVTLSGSGFSGATQVTFNNTPAASFTVDSTTQIRATVPGGATSGPIAVTGPGGTGVSSASFTVTSTPPPTPSISGFSPNHGPVGTVVTLSGSGFSGATQVTFNNTPAASFTVDSNSQIRATVPGGASSGPIAVTGPGGTGVSSASFTVDQPLPTYSLTVTTSGSGAVSLNPPGGSYSAGTVVTLTATPAAGWAFSGWSGALSGTANPATLTMDANKTVTATFTEVPSGGNHIIFMGTVMGSAVNSNSVTTTASLSADSGDLYLAAVSSRNSGTVSAVTGLGLTWTRLVRQCAGRNQTMLDVWYAQGSPTSGGPVTATFPGALASSVIVASQYSGVNPTAPVGAVVRGNTLGANGACSGGVDNSSYSFTLTTTASGAVVWGAASMRNRAHTPGSGYTERAEQQAGSSGNVSSVAVMDKPAPAPVATTVNGTFSGSVDWAVVGVEIRP